MNFSKRDAAIDCLRGFSILSVLSTHGVIPQPDGNIAAILRYGWRNGYYGVIVFFVISGFLISSTAISRYGRLERIDLLDFYTRRIARIAPCLILVLALASGLHAAGAPDFVTTDPATFWKAIVNALYLQFNWFYATGGNVPGVLPISPLWSLSIEEVFYISFPIGCLLLGRTLHLTAALGVVVAVAFMYRTNAQDFYLFAGTADSIALGCISAIAAQRLNTLGDRVKNIASRIMRYSGLSVIGFVFLKTQAQDYSTINVLLVACGTAVFLLGNSLARPWLSLKIGAPIFAPLAIIGTLSYELYVFHMPIKFAVVDLVPTRLQSQFVVIGAIFTLAALLHYSFSEPLRKIIVRRTSASIGKARPGGRTELNLNTQTFTPDMNPSPNAAAFALMP